MTDEYCVVYEKKGPRTEGGGTRFWSIYGSKEKFEKRSSKDNDKYRIVAQGLSKDEAKEIASQRSLLSDVGLAVSQATDEDGEVHDSVLEMKLKTTRLARFS